NRTTELGKRPLRAADAKLEAAGSASALLGAGSRGAAAYEGVPVGLAVSPPAYAVADEHTLTPPKLDPAAEDHTFIEGWARAAEKLRSLPPDQRRGLQVVETDDVFPPSEPAGVLS